MKDRGATLVTEFLVVVIGVLVALAADSAMERRREARSAREALSALQRDVAADLASFETFWVPRFEDRRASRKRLETFVSGLDPISDSVQFVQDVLLVSTYFTFDPNISAVEELKNSGRLHLIESDEVRGVLLDYLRSVQNVNDFDRIHRSTVADLSGQLTPRIVGGFALPRGFEMSGLGTDPTLARSSAARALDAARIRSSDLLRQLLVATAVPFTIQDDRYQDLQKRAEELMSLLSMANGARN